MQQEHNPKITNLITLTRFLLSPKNPHKDDRIELSNLFSGIALACKIVSNAIKRAGFESLLGVSGKKNVHDEEVKKLDEVANEAFVTALVSTQEVCVMVSEEEPKAIIVDEVHAGRFVLAFDPLDGSSNLDANVSVGSIFSVWKKKSSGKTGETEDALRLGRDMVVGGYVLYGSATIMVITLGNGVFGFTLDQAVGEFVLTHSDIKIKPRGSIYSVNEGNSAYWDKATSDYVNSIKSSKGRTPYSLRYVGSMVSDVHRTLLYGGIFLYPGDSKSPNGKLRYLYEVAPLSFIMEQAGGRSSTGRQQCLDILPKDIHVRVPVFMGSSDDVADVETSYKSTL